MAKLIDLEGIKERLHRCDVRELEDYIYFLCDEIDRLRGENSILKEVGESANRLRFDLFNSLQEMDDKMATFKSE